MTEAEIIARLIAKAKEVADGHFTICRFTRNWRVGFITPHDRCDICDLHAGKTLAEAAEKALADGAKRRRDVWEHCTCHAERAAREQEEFDKFNRLYDAKPEGSA